MIFLYKSIYSSQVIQWCMYKNHKIRQSYTYISMCHFCLKAKNGFVKGKGWDMMLLSKFNYSSWVILWYLQLLTSETSYKYMPFRPKMAQIRSIRTRDMILVSKRIYLSWEIQWCIYKNTKITHSYKHRDFKMFAPFNSTARVDTLRHQN